MPSPKLISALFVAAFACCSSINELHAAPVPAPDDQQLVSDLTGHYVFAGAAELGAGSAEYGPLESTVIRSSVRRGEVLELRVSSLRHDDLDRTNSLEVDSIVTYRMDGDRWALIGVQTERTRTMTGSGSSDSC